VSKSGKVLAACSSDKTIKLFDISELSTKSPQMIQSVSTTHTSYINSIGFSSDNMLFASAGNDKTLILYSVYSNYINNTLNDYLK